MHFFFFYSYVLHIPPVSSLIIKHKAQNNSNSNNANLLQSFIEKIVCKYFKSGMDGIMLMISELRALP